MMTAPASFEQAAARQKEWTGVRRLSRWNRNRRLRRVVVAVWLVLLIAGAGIVAAVARQRAASALYPTLTLFALTLWAFRRMDMGLAQPSLEDRAAIEYGEAFDSLSEAERVRIFEQQLREGIMGRARQDEREAELRLRAEGIAYRVLRPGLVLTAAAYWAACLLGPFAAIRGPLAVTAVLFTLLVLMVLVLPTMVRLWTEADEMGEPQILRLNTNL